MVERLIRRDKDAPPSTAVHVTAPVAGAASARNGSAPELQETVR
jgi:hypothetical protein